MTINHYHITYNSQIPKSIVIYLRKRMNSLAFQLRKRLETNYNIQLNFSKKSEAGYFLITPVFDLIDRFNDYKDISISIRNHRGRLNEYDLAIYLCDFDTWDDLRRFFIYDCAPYIKNFDKEGLAKEFNNYALHHLENSSMVQ